MSITGPQKSALLWLKNRGGDGVFDRTNCLCASGERAGVNRSTWSILATRGLVSIHTAGAKAKRCKITEEGQQIDLSGVLESHCKEIWEDA